MPRRKALVASQQLYIADDAATTRRKSYTLDKHNAIAKKIASCSRNMRFEEKKDGNRTISLSTAAFEAFRELILTNIHLPTGPSRHIEYVKDIEEGEGLIVQDTLKIKSWQALHQPLSHGKTGSCSVTINMYRTNSSALINGRDSKIVFNAVKKLLTEICNDDQIKLANQKIKSTLGKITKRNDGAMRRNDPRHQIPDIESCAVTDANLSEQVDRPALAIEDTQSDEDICPTCNAAVQNHEGDPCNKCFFWYHYKCEGLNKTQAEVIEEGAKPLTCKSCHLLNRINPADTAENIDILQTSKPTSLAGQVTMENNRPTAPSTPVQVTAPAPLQHATGAQGSLSPRTQNSCTTTTYTASAPIPAAAVSPSTVLPLALLSTMPPVTCTSTALLTVSRMGTPITSIANIAAGPWPTTLTGYNYNQAHPAPPPSHAKNVTDRILEQLDTTTADYNNLQLKYQDLCAEQMRIKSVNEIQKADLETNRKKWLTREKQLKARESAIITREANQNERDEQIVLLKTHVHKMECKINDLEEQNKLLKLKLLTSEEIRAENPSTASHIDNNSSLANTLQTTLLIAASNMLTNSMQNKECSHTTKIVNVYQPNRQYTANKSQKNKSKKEVFNYNHRSTPTRAEYLEHYEPRNLEYTSGEMHTQRTVPPKDSTSEGSRMGGTTKEHKDITPSVQDNNAEKESNPPAIQANNNAPLAATQANNNAPLAQDSEDEADETRNSSLIQKDDNPQNHFLGVSQVPKPPDKPPSKSQHLM